MTAKEVTINYLNAIKRNYQGILETQLKREVHERYVFFTMQYLVAIEIAIEAVEEEEKYR